MKRRASRLSLPAALLLLGACAACGGGSTATTAGSKAIPKKAETLTAAELEAKLAAADAIDGQVDHVIDRCSGCGLAMPGKAEHVITVEGYQLHMCSSSCKARFGEDLDAALAALEVPKS